MRKLTMNFYPKMRPQGLIKIYTRLCMMMVEKLMDQKRKYWSRAMKKGRCNLDEEPIKEVRPTVRTTPQKFSWIGFGEGNHREKRKSTRLLMLKHR